MGTLHTFNFDFNTAKPQQSDNINPEIAFCDFIQQHGYRRPDSIIPDRQIHRYGKDKVDWYVFFPDEFNPGGSFGCWKKPNENSIDWCFRGAEMSASERAAHESRMKQIRAQVATDQERIYAQAREEVAKAWEAAKEPESHPYLIRKKIKAHGIRMLKGDLLIPMRDKDGLLHSLQKITPDSTKLFWTGGKAAGQYHTIHGAGNYAYLCEGYATGATIHEATGSTVYVAFSSSNLVKVARDLPDNVIVAADDDHATEGNPGRTAAEKTGRRFIIPKGITGTDFNDLAVEKGLDEVRRQLTASFNKFTRRILSGAGLHDGFIQTLKMGWTIDKVFPESSMLSVVFGPPSGGKSFTVLDMCCSIDSGTSWHGRKVKKKPVLYLAAEGQAGMLKRIEAWTKRRGISLPTFSLLPMPCLIDEDTQRRELLNMINELPQKPGVIVLDTLARSMTGDENSTSDMGKVVIAAGILIEETGAQVIIIHHTGKDESKGPRGAIALTGATDTMLKVVRLKEDKKFVLLCERQKDDEPFAPMVFRFEVVGTGYKNQDGDEVSSLVPEFDPEGTAEFGETPEKGKAVKHSRTQEKAILALEITIRERGIYPPDEILSKIKGLVAPNSKVVLIDDWKNECVRLGISSGESRAQNKTFKTTIEKLEMKKTITILGGYVWKN